MVLEQRGGAAARTAVMKVRGGPGRRQARVSGGDLPTINSPMSGNLRMNIEHHQGFQKTLLDLSSRAKTPLHAKRMAIPSLTHSLRLPYFSSPTTSQPVKLLPQNAENHARYGPSNVLFILRRYDKTRMECSNPQGICTNFSSTRDTKTLNAPGTHPHITTPRDYRTFGMNK